MKAEHALAASAAAPVAKAASTPATARKSAGGDADLLVKSAVATMEAYLARRPVEDIIAKRYGDDDRVKAVSGAVTKAAQNPAMTNVAGWAQELTRESYASFMELLKGESVIPKIPMARYDFAGSTKINIPSRAAATTPNLAGSFRAEGAPIRVGAASLTSTALTPKQLGIIGTFTNELFERSTPNIEQAIRNWMIEDTAYAMDQAFLGDTAGTAVVPAGIQAGIAAGDTRVSAGVAAANITADIRGAFQSFGCTQHGPSSCMDHEPCSCMGH